MTSIILVTLFLLQLVSFYLITLLFTKINRVKEIENKQEQLLVDMENSFGAYIAEIKDENNRLLQELKKTEINAAMQSEVVEQEKINSDEVPSFELPKSFVSKQVAASSYLKTAKINEKEVPITIKEKVLYYNQEGKTVNEIAKLLQIGITEVELFLKFND
jgi:hypothetical protein